MKHLKSTTCAGLILIVMTSCTTATNSQKQAAEIPSQNQEVTTPAVTEVQTTQTSTESAETIIPTLTPSVPLDPSLGQWVQYKSSTFPVTFLYASNLLEGEGRFVEQSNGDLVIEYPDQTQTIFMETRKALPNESDVAAIKRLYFSKIPQENQSECMIASEAYYSTSTEATTKSVTRYEIVPKNMNAEDSDEPWWVSGEKCGDHALTNGHRVFEFHEGKEYFIYYAQGQDGAGLDTETITILK